MFDVAFLTDINVDHSRFIYALSTVDEIKRKALYAGDKWKKINGNDKIQFRNMLKNMMLFLKWIYNNHRMHHVSDISDTDYSSLLKHMHEETEFALDLLLGDVDKNMIVSFWKNNFAEHFKLLSDIWPTNSDKLLYDKKTLQKIASDAFPDDNVDFKLLHDILDEARKFITKLDLLTYKTAQHEMIEMRYGLQQLAKYK
jgi:hypothetical protein